MPRVNITASKGFRGVVRVRDVTRDLDRVSTPLVLLGLVQLRSAYAGPLIRVRRSSDNAEQDIPSERDGTLDISAFEAFVGTATAFLRTVYDQSGSGNHATQTTAAEQPTITASRQGVIRFSRARGDSLFLPTGLLDLAAAWTLAISHKTTNFGASNAGLFGPSASNSSGLEVLEQNVSSRPTALRVNGTFKSVLAGNLWPDATPTTTVVSATGGVLSAFSDGAPVTLADATAATLNFNGIYSIGRYNSSANGVDSDVSMFGLWTQALTPAERSIVEML